MSSSRSGDNYICPGFHMQGIGKVSHSSQNPGREYMKCLRCDKFLKWVNDDNGMGKRILVMLTEIKKEFSELRMLVKLIEKGQSVVYMLLVGAAIGSPRLQLGLLSVLDECLELESGLDGLGMDSNGVLSGFFRDDLIYGLDGYEVNCKSGVDCNGEQCSGMDYTVDYNRGSLTIVTPSTAASKLLVLFNGVSKLLHHQFYACNNNRDKESQTEKERRR
ncbi:hypothetical protein Cgig2_030219 [Carnegiea gigantea]|uniref:Uncharacterized protein n=1 Tax=Carnegiea gigantea TaxID=171969 RepID=A0A9Q1GHY0_9CARY|nr:hypothetical protein Cgig2_030219 [Carnegiea gigantea]